MGQRCNLVCALVLIVSIYAYLSLIKYETGVYINELMVKDMDDKKHAADLLFKVKESLCDLTKKLSEHKHPDKDTMEPYVSRLQARIHNVTFRETLDDYNGTTSYSIDKGKSIHLCLRSKNMPRSLHDINTVMYVAIHEMSHIACPEFGHTRLFYDIMYYILDVAQDLGYIKLSGNSVEYCGLSIVV